MMRRTWVGGLSLLFAVSLSASVQAQSSNGIYLFGGVGYAEQGAKASDFSTTYALGAPGAPNDVITTSESHTAYKFGIGYRINKYIAVEGSYGRIGEFNYNDDRPGAFAGNFRAEVKPEAWQFSAVGILPLSELVSKSENFEIFGKVGIAHVRNKGSLSSTGAIVAPVGDPGSLANDTTPVIGIGLNYEMTKHFFVRGEFEHYFEYDVLNVPDLRPTLGPFAQPGGNIKNDTNIFNIVVGFKF